LWYYQPGESLPSLTMVGSSNFGYRLAAQQQPCGSGMFYLGSGMFYLGSGMFYLGSDHFLIPDPNIFSSRIAHEKLNAKLQVLFSCLLGFHEQSLTLTLNQKDPGSGKKFIPDPGGKKAPDPDPQKCSAVLVL
jgi:hypothetical protein